MKVTASPSFQFSKSGNPNHSTPWGRYRHGCDPPLLQRNALNILFSIRFMLITVLLSFVTLPITGFSAMPDEEPETSSSAKDFLLPLIVHLEQPLHFGNSDGQDTVVSPGMYLVEPSILKEPQLFLWHENGTVTLQAIRTTHGQSIKTPEAHLFREETTEDIHDVVVFLPDGTALEATGSVKGIQTRGKIRAIRRYKMDQETGVVQFGDGQQGRRLPTNQSNISAQYRYGSGSQDGELDMIKLQSLMSQRAMALTLAQNLLNSLNGRFQLEEGIDRPGDDYAHHKVENPESCKMRCAGDGNCQAFTFVKSAQGATQGQCFLKRSEPQPVANHCCVSGTRSSRQDKIIRNIK